MKIRVLIVDDHQMVRVGLRTILERFPQLEIIGDAGNITDAMSRTRQLAPDVVLVDMRLGNESGADLCRQIHSLESETRTLVLTSYADEQAVFDAIAAGADGYLLKEIAGESLARAIEQVVSGQSVLDPAVTRAVMGRVKQRGLAEPENKLQILSAQERKVLALVAEGKTNKEVAMAMGLSAKTVKNYFSNILEKLGMSRRSQAAAFYVQNRPGDGN